MRILVLFLGCIWLSCGQLVAADANGITVEPALLERKAKFSFSKKGMNKKSSRKKRGILGLNRKKSSGVSKARSQGFWRKNKKDRRGGKQNDKKGFFNFRRRRAESHADDDHTATRSHTRNRRNDARDSKRELHHRDVTGALQDEIEADQHEHAFIEGTSSTTLKEASEHIKDRLTRLITRDIKDAMQELEGVH
ncbi:hypothetical protein X943_003276 [Babesia divergens]|uniref:Uncharacterized protein n=1 Tax=Babesia divergens TaxID=32595 RepID=A0AAD9LEJ3_BABDI|nr:hypothetical protein X943_003276 [Babesia divergens]